jgi:hypothetical protein
MMREVEIIRQGIIASSGAAYDPLALQPTKINGCALWLDGQCNTRAGVNKSFLGMQNLMYPPPKNSKIYLNETVNTAGNVWKGDILDLGNYSNYPVMYNTSMTIETVIRITATYTDYLRPFSCHSGGGGAIQIKPSTTTIGIAFYDTAISDYSTVYSAENALALDTLYYAWGQMVSGSYLKLQVMGAMSEVAQASMGASRVPSSQICSRIGSKGSTAATTTVNNYSGLEMGMLRVWTRILTAAEIQERYLDAKERFGVL